MHRYLPPCEILITRSGSTVTLKGLEPEAKLYQLNFQPAGPSTEQVSVTLPPAGMVVGPGISVAQGLSSVKRKQVNYSNGGGLKNKKKMT